MTFDHETRVEGWRGAGQSEPVGSRTQYVCGAVGLVVVLAVLTASYSTVVAATSVLSLLSTTALVLGVLVAWIAVSLLLAAAVRQTLVLDPAGTEPAD